MHKNGYKLIKAKEILARAERIPYNRNFLMIKMDKQRDCGKCGVPFYTE